jgi:hypothetical protein
MPLSKRDVRFVEIVALNWEPHGSLPVVPRGAGAWAADADLDIRWSETNEMTVSVLARTASALDTTPKKLRPEATRGEIEIHPSRTPPTTGRMKRLSARI